jgi:CRP-like cAMP-binding protein
MTVRARSDVQAAHIDYERFKQLYFQNPEFGFRLLRLIVGRMQEGHERPGLSPAAP